MSTEYFQYAMSPDDEKKENSFRLQRFRQYIKSIALTNPVLNGIELYKLNSSDIDFYNKFVAGQLTLNDINIQRSVLGGRELGHIAKARKVLAHFNIGGSRESLMDQDEIDMYPQVESGFLNDKRINHIEKSLIKGTEDFSASLQLLDFMEDEIRNKRNSQYKLAS